jgi:hypothetical protein
MTRLLNNPQMPRDLYRTLHAQGVEIAVEWWRLPGGYYQLSILACRGGQPLLRRQKLFNSLYIATCPQTSSLEFWHFVKATGHEIRSCVAADA